MRKLTATQIKVIAIIAMTLDHIAYTFVPPESAASYIMRLFGRITAPLMCFFIAEGFKYTHDRKKYLLRMITFAVISQPLYLIFHNHSLPKNALEFFRSMNVMYTFSLGLLTLFIVTNKKLPMPAKAILTAITISFANIGDWSYLIPIWVLVFYYFSDDKKIMYLLFSITALILLPYLYLKYFDSFLMFTYNYGVFLALIPIALYNGQRNKDSSPLKKSISKWFFYVYYPLHMMVIFFASHA